MPLFYMKKLIFWKYFCFDLYFFLLDQIAF